MDGSSVLGFWQWEFGKTKGGCEVGEKRGGQQELWIYQLELCLDWYCVIFCKDHGFKKDFSIIFNDPPGKGTVESMIFPTSRERWGMVPPVPWRDPTYYTTHGGNFKGENLEVTMAGLDSTVGIGHVFLYFLVGN